MIKEDEILKKRIIELAGKCYGNSQFIFTDFLSPSEISIVLNMQNEIEYVDYELYGGAEMCERKVLKLGSCEMFGYDEDYPISCIIIEPLIKKFADNLSHRDYLGALMNLGIERSTIGDIFVKDKTAYIFCVDRIADYISENLDQVRHTHVKCIITKDKVDAIEPDLKDTDIVVNSERIDAIIAKVYKMSRSQSIEYFREKKVFINGRTMENNSYILKPDDVVSVRGFGKFIFDGMENETKKGRIKVRVKIYQ